MKIDLDWIKKELAAGRKVELECVDKEGYKRENPDERSSVLNLDKIIVTSTHLAGVSIKNANVAIMRYELKYFRIKHSTPTFDDLIDVLIKAKKDNIVSRVEINRNSLNATVNLTDSKIAEFCISKDAGGIVFKERIDWINSLYTETFVIESEEDMRKMRIESKGVLPNGLEFKVTDTAVKMFYGENDLAITVNFNGMDHNELLYLSPLKGATVTQKR